MFLLKCLWQIEICKLDFAWRYLYIPEVWKFEFQQPVFKKVTWVGLNSLWELKFKMSFHDSVKTIFSKHQNKIIFVIRLINSRSRMTLKSSVVIFGTLKPFVWNESSKIQFFTDIWYLFCQRLLRPAYVTFLETGWWNSNFQTSGIYTPSGKF